VNVKKNLTFPLSKTQPFVELSIANGKKKKCSRRLVHLEWTSEKGTHFVHKKEKNNSWY